jgi:hypothetical protein
MKMAANNRRMYIGGWLAAALVLLTANLLKLSQLEFQPLAASPPVVNQLRLHLLQYNELVSARQVDAETGLEPPITLARIRPTPPSSLPTLAASPDELFTPARTQALPLLTGILQVVDADAGHYRAVIEGNVYSEKEYVAELRIEEISAHGVVVSRSNQRWFIPAPEVHYSIGQKP